MSNPRLLLLPGLFLLLSQVVHAQVLLDPTQAPPSAFEREIAAIESVAELSARSEELGKAGRYADQAVVLRRMVLLQPQVGRHRYELAAAFARQGDRRSAYDILLRLHGQGYAFDIGADDRFAKVADTRVWEYLVANYQGNRQPFGSGSVSFELPASDRLVESLAWDARHQRWLFGSLRDGGIYTRDADGALVPFVESSADNGLWSVLDLKVDAGRGRLWVASAAMPFFEGLRREQLGLTGLFLFDLDSGKLQKRWLIPPGERLQALTALALGRQGEVYALDGLTQTVYRADEEGMRPVFGSPKLAALRALVVSEDGNRLYLADYDAGITVVDLARSKAFDLRIPQNLTLDGIESLHMWDGHLVLVQSGTDPAMRVMRLHLSADGLEVTRAQPVDASQPAMTQPVSGALHGPNLYFIANSQKRLYGDDGRLREGVRPEPVRVFRSDLSVSLELETAPAVD
ncbi:MAG TPA: hypothetical protein PKZ76_07660 [Xanthomonadaceae bacterium]|nr:hypothetical protein [Xanthomonadaceae bacterium]